MDQARAFLEVPDNSAECSLQYLARWTRWAAKKNIEVAYRKDAVVLAYRAPAEGIKYAENPDLTGGGLSRTGSNRLRAWREFRKETIEARIGAPYEVPGWGEILLETAQETGKDIAEEVPKAIGKAIGSAGAGVFEGFGKWVFVALAVLSGAVAIFYFRSKKP